MSNIDKSSKGLFVCDSSTSTTDRSDTDLTLQISEYPKWPTFEAIKL